MIMDICETESRGDAAGSAGGTKQAGFADTKRPSSFQYIAGTIMLRSVKRGVRIIPDAISDGIIKINRLQNRIISIFDCRHSEINDYLRI